MTGGLPVEIVRSLRALEEEKGWTRARIASAIRDAGYPLRRRTSYPIIPARPDEDGPRFRLLVGCLNEDGYWRAFANKWVPGQDTTRTSATHEQWRMAVDAVKRSDEGF